MSISRRMFSTHEVRQGALMDNELIDRNLDAVYMGARDSVFFSALTPFLPFAACPETFPVNSAKTGGRWEVELDTAADLVTGVAMVVELPGLVGKVMDGSVGIAAVRNGADLGAAYNVTAEDIIEPHYHEAVGQHLMKKTKFVAGSHTLSVSNADYLMILSEGHGVNKPRTSGERIGYYASAVEQCQRSMRSQLLVIDLGLFMCQDDRLAAPFSSMSVVTKKLQGEFENLRNLIVRPVVPYNTLHASGGNAWVNAWDSGHFKVFEQPDSADLYSISSATRELLSGSTQEIDLTAFVECRTIYVAEDEAATLTSENHTMVIPQLQSQIISVSGTPADNQETTADLNFTNGVKALYIVGRTQASREANDWMDTSGGHDGRDLVRRDVLAYCKLLQGTANRIDATGDWLRRTEGYRYFATEPRQDKTMLYANAFENYRDLTGQQGVVNFARLRTKRMTLTAPAHAFEMRRIDATSGELALTGEKTKVEYYVGAESFQSVTFAVHRAVPAFSTPGHS